MRYSKNSAYRKPVAVMPVSKKKKNHKAMLKKSWKKKNTFKLKVSKIKEIKMTRVEIK